MPLGLNKERHIRTLVAIFTLISLFGDSFAEELCSRVVEINSQEVLIDLNSTQKGEGLRNYLEKDPVASSYLDKYQEGTKFKWQETVLGTGGALAILTGLSMGNRNSSTKKTFIVTGAVLIVVHFIVGYSLKKANESNLEKAIEEYNQRNLPKININPLSNNGPSESEILLAHTWEF